MAKGFYVSVERAAPAGVKRGWLLGPYPSKEAAKGHVQRARLKACEVDPRCAWDAFGVSSIDREGAELADLPAGVLNALIELEGELGL